MSFVLSVQREYRGTRLPVEGSYGLGPFLGIVETTFAMAKLDRRMQRP